MQIFFDLDGTLIDVSERNYRVYKEVTALFRGTPLPKEKYWEFKRKKTKWPVLLPLSGLAADIEPVYLAEFIQKIEEPEYLKLDMLYLGALDAVDELARKNECYIVSLRRNHDNLLRQIEWLHLAPHFTMILSGHSEGDGYDVKTQLIKEELREKEGIIIGDTEADIIAGQTLGIVTVALTSGIRDAEFLTELKPDHIVAGIGDVVPLLQDKNG
jgi:phosphoglycolate phosphatase-like HAD superfamily hydrolase